MHPEHKLRCTLSEGFDIYQVFFDLTAYFFIQVTDQTLTGVMDVLQCPDGSSRKQPCRASAGHLGWVTLKMFLKQMSPFSAPHRFGFFLLRELSAFPCSEQFKWSDPRLCVSVHACQCALVRLLICVFATGLHWSGFRLIPALIQIMSQMMINCFFSLTRSCRTKAMNFECDKRWNSFSTTIRSCLPERSLPASLSHYVNAQAV